MFLPGRRKSIAFYIAFGACLITVILVLYIGWWQLSWRHGALLVLGVLLLIIVISGVVLNTISIVREIHRNEQKDAFINAMTHELKTPVASIRLYLQTLQTRAVDDEKRKEFYRIMLEDSDRLLATIEQVLRTGRLGAAGRKLNLVRIDLARLVEECIARTRTLHSIPPESLTFHPCPPVSIMADIEDVTAAVSNLIENAVKYSGKEVNVRVETELLNGHVLLRVKDAGVGIPKTELKRVFRRFHRVPGPLASRIKGTGLGLFIVRSVAKRHGGRAWAESDGAGRGSTFFLELPVAK